MSYKLITTYALSGSQGSQYKTTGRMIVVHSTANIGASAENNASYEKREWKNTEAYVHFIAGDGVVYSVGATGYQAWGAGGTANALAPVQIEMEETNDHAKFMRIVQTTAELVRDMAKKYNVPLTLNADSTTGIKTHRWCARRWGETSHTDPETYFSRMGYSDAQFAKAITGASTAKPAKPEYFDWRAVWMYTLQTIKAYKSATDVGTGKNVAKSYPKGTKLETKQLVGHRFQLTNGLWVTANKAYINNLYYTPGSKVKVVESVGGTYRYSDLALTKKGAGYSKGTQFDVEKVVKYGHTSRILLGNGKYISGSKLINKFVE
ncbi:DUF5776 domain-containing protein [Secundilactobacillus muriivasis]